MITRIDLQHFKCFEALTLPLCPLTLLSGSNASGKSSVMQALVLLHQTMREHEWSSRLMLNGATVRLGKAADIIDQVSGRRNCSISLIDRNSDHFEWEFEGERDELSLAIKRSRGETKSNGSWDTDGSKGFQRMLPKSSSTHSITNRMCRLAYLTAERLGPREIYQHDDPQLTPVVGPQGEHAVSILHSNGESKVLPELTRDGKPSTLHRQVEAWMTHFFPGCVLEVNSVPRTNTVTLGICVSSETEFLRPVHSGFGLTQVLPIIVAALSANKDDFVLIENPEVHLHPAAQVEMGQFLAYVASAGVQVITETHSDHVLNGIRRAVKEGILPNKDVTFHFFKPRFLDGKENLSQVESPMIDANGSIDTWPDGFFDQFDKDMNYFAGWS